VPEIRRASILRAPADAVWARVTTFAGINDEFRPLMRMTAPKAVRAAGIADAPVGERVCRSWILLGGVLPVEYDDLTLVEVEPGRFLERSSMLTQRVWEHERTVVPHPEGALLTDRVAFTPRRGIPSSATARITAAVFDYRHRRLQQRFHGRPAD
jgi:ligand-binding SRPBCC domain-containing protein